MLRKPLFCVNFKSHAQTFNSRACRYRQEKRSPFFLGFFFLLSECFIADEVGLSDLRVLCLFASVQAHVRICACVH